mmetsp:Transcript_16736/g.43117  ORF Transcript_16736/g.43117 Transcript_16736/m.43117 type:complete len:144 (+) Transcript_16736:166-597(+)
MDPPIPSPPTRVVETVQITVPPPFEAKLSYMKLVLQRLEKKHDEIDEETLEERLWTPEDNKRHSDLFEEREKIVDQERLLSYAVQNLHFVKVSLRWFHQALEQYEHYISKFNRYYDAYLSRVEQVARDDEINDGGVGEEESAD